MSSIIRMQNVNFSWKGENSFSMSLPDFSAAQGKKLLLIGPSGSGKSTFLSLLCGIISPDTGLIEVLGKDLKGLGGAGRDRFRANHFGIIFQMFNLLPYGSVIDNVLLPLKFANSRKNRVLSNTSLEDEARRLLARLGLEDKNLHRKNASQLSVGQQQRVAAARALIGTPEIIVADEPTSSLDRSRQLDFLDLLSEEVAKSGSTLIMVSHDETLASRFDDVVSITDMISTQKEATA